MLFLMKFGRSNKWQTGTHRWSTSHKIIGMVRVLEFFSGIGGMRLSLSGALAPLSSDTDSVNRSENCTATTEEDRENRIRGGTCDLSLQFTSFDTSDSVNKVYRFNFPGEKLRQVNIESIKASEMDAFAAEVWTMSPPCQPFTTTQNSKRLDVSDMRNKAFLHLMKCLESMTRRPEWIFFENVKGFEGSESHILWADCLTRCGYEWQQYLLSPLQFRVPNGRTRFYMAIHRITASGDRMPGFSQDIPLFVGDDIAKAHEVIIDDITGPEGINPISSYLDSGAKATEEYILDNSILVKNWAAGLSIVGREDRCTFCFTSSYGKTFHRSSGSILHMEEPRGRRVVRAANMSETHSNKMRLFTPYELLRIFGFPDDFTYPTGMSTKHMYKCIGQSINVVVVRSLMHAVLCAAHQQGRLTFTLTSEASPNCDSTAVAVEESSNSLHTSGADGDDRGDDEHPLKKAKCSEL